MTLSNTSLAATSGAILVGAYLIDPSSIPFVAAGVAATWTRVFMKRNASRGMYLSPCSYQLAFRWRIDSLKRGTQQYLYAIAPL